MSRFPRLAVLLAVAGLMTAGAPAANADTTASPARHCNEGSGRGFNTNYVLWIHNRGVSCRRAKRLIRAFHDCRPGARGRCPRVNGWNCSENRGPSGRGSFYSTATCRRNGNLVRHRYNQWT